MFHTFAALAALTSINSPLPDLDDAWGAREVQALDEVAADDALVDRAWAQSIVLGIEAYAATRATSAQETEHAALLVTLTIRPEVWLLMASAPAPIASEADVDLDDPSTDPQHARLAAFALCGCAARGRAP